MGDNITKYLEIFYEAVDYIQLTQDRVK